ncbi:MAG: hypothetical protein ACI4XB_09205 [Ruminococcus sp.]
MKAKQLWIGIVCLCLCFTAACGSQGGSGTADSDTKKTTAAEESSEAAETEASEKDTEESSETGTFNTETMYWKANIPDTLAEDEDYSSEDEGYTDHFFASYDSSDTVENGVEIIVTEEDSLSYRQDLLNYDLALEDYAAGNVDTTSIGGYDFTVVEYEYWGETETVYLTRDEGAQMSITIRISGDPANEDIQTVLSSLEFTIPEGNETDAPYPWDGEPLVTQTGSVTLGSYNLTATQILASDSILPNDIFDNRVAVAGNTLYALTENHLFIFTLNGSDAALQETVELEDDYDHICVDETGAVYLSAFMKPTLVYRDGKQVMSLNVKDQLAVSPDGSWGITYFTSADDLEKVTIQADGAVQTEAFSLGENLISLVNEISITKDYILVSGSAADDSGHKLFVFDHSGAHLKTLTDADGESLGSITGAVQTDNGILAIDGNLRNVILWNLDGGCLGEAEDSDLFGTSYPWISGLCRTSDGKIYISMVEERTDGSWDEMILFQLDGNF